MPTLLVCTVGGTEGPIAFRINFPPRPDRVFFVCSASSRPKVAAIIALAAAAGTNLPVGCHDIFEIGDFENIAICLKDMERLLNGPVSDWLQRGPDYSVIVDITGGSKAMSAALTMVSRRWRCSVSYVGGSRRSKDGLGAVEDSSEKIFVVVNPVEQLGWTVIEDALALASGNNYDSAFRLLEAAKRRGANPEATREIAALQHTLGFFAARDRFDFKRAEARIQDIRRSLNDLRAVLHADSVSAIAAGLDLWQTELLELAKTSTVSFLLIRELLANADRRHQEGRSDDALARLYRAIEAMAQFRLFTAFNIPDTNRIPVSELPPQQKARFSARSPNGFAQLPLQECYSFLYEFQDILGLEFYAQELHGKKSPLNARNHSILAHGFQPIGANDFDALWSKTIPLAQTIGVYQQEFPRFPQLTARGHSVS